MSTDTVEWTFGDKMQMIGGSHNKLTALSFDKGDKNLMLLMQLNVDWLETICAERRDFFGAKINTKYILYRLFFDAFNTLSAAACFSCVTKGHLPLCQRVNQTFRIFVFDALHKKVPRIFIHIPFYEALHYFLSVVCTDIFTK